MQNFDKLVCRLGTIKPDFKNIPQVVDALMEDVHSENQEHLEITRAALNLGLRAAFIWIFQQPREPVDD